MNFMDIATQAASSLMGDKGGAGNIITAITQLVEQNGGMSKMMEKFNGAGLGEIAQSWISTGQNLPISADQISKVFGNGQIEQIAKSLNLNGTDLSQTLSNFLPQIVDKLTPNGQVASESLDMNSLLEIGKSFLK